MKYIKYSSASIIVCLFKNAGGLALKFLWDGNVCRSRCDSNEYRYTGHCTILSDRHSLLCEYLTECMIVYVFEILFWVRQLEAVLIWWIGKWIEQTRSSYLNHLWWLKRLKHMTVTIISYDWPMILFTICVNKVVNLTFFRNIQHGKCRAWKLNILNRSHILVCLWLINSPMYNLYSMPRYEVNEYDISTNLIMPRIHFICYPLITAFNSLVRIIHFNNVTVPYSKHDIKHSLKIFNLRCNK